MFKTDWTHRHTPVLNKQQEERLNQEIAHISDDLDRASDLIFHTFFLTEDMEGAIVILSGKGGVDDTVYLTYYEQPEWTTLNDFD